MKNFWDNLKEVLINFFQGFGWAWWVEITTQTPRCTYYFGPFRYFAEARDAHFGYVEDLRNEAAQEITVTIKRCQPDVLTVCASEMEK